MNDIVIQFDRVGKLYKLGLVGTGTLSHDLNRWWQVSVLGHEDPYLRIGETNDRRRKGKTDYVWALRDITIDVHQGDVIGIIGKNGAGKSTLLKLLSRVTAPTTGNIRVRGRIASLLEVGTGFHPEMTGRENIYMNGAIMGMTRHEISRKLDEIVDFAGVERYVDTPVKRYSNGMSVRLGFAVAAFLEPEILVVDEVLAVGDAEFQRKAIGKMQDVTRGEGRTVLFVSHNMAAVSNLCQRGIVLKDGTIDYMGGADEAIGHYLSADMQQESDDSIIEHVGWKKSWLKINELKINDTSNYYSVVNSNQHTINVVIAGETEEDMKTDVMVVFKTLGGVPLCTLAEGHSKGKVISIKKGPFRIERTIRLPKFIWCGDCEIDLCLHYPMVEFQLRALNCAQIHFDGYYEEFGTTEYIKNKGFIGLESIE